MRGLLGLGSCIACDERPANRRLRRCVLSRLHSAVYSSTKAQAIYRTLCDALLLRIALWRREHEQQNITSSNAESSHVKRTSVLGFVLTLILALSLGCGAATPAHAAWARDTSKPMSELFQAIYKNDAARVRAALDADRKSVV